MKGCQFQQKEQRSKCNYVCEVKIKLKLQT